LVQSRKKNARSPVLRGSGSRKAPQGKKVVEDSRVERGSPHYNRADRVQTESL